MEWTSAHRLVCSVHRCGGQFMGTECSKLMKPAATNRLRWVIIWCLVRLTHEPACWCLGLAAVIWHILATCLLIKFFLCLILDCDLAVECSRCKNGVYTVSCWDVVILLVPECCELYRSGVIMEILAMQCHVDPVNVDARKFVMGGVSLRSTIFFTASQKVRWWAWISPLLNDLEPLHKTCLNELCRTICGLDV